MTRGKIACENILRARICTAVRTVAKGAHISFVYCVHRPMDCILPIHQEIQFLVGREGVNKHAVCGPVCFKQVKNKWRHVNEKHSLN